MRSFIVLASIMLTLTACKTTEELQREQMVDNLSIQMTQAQKLSAETKIKLQEMEDRLNQINGALEEQGHKVDKTYSSKMRENNEKILLLEKIQLEQNNKIAKIEEELAAQKKYIEDVLHILKKVDRTVEDQKQRSPYNQAFYLFNKGKYKQAKPQLLALLNNKKIKGKKRARVLNALGMLNYWQRHDDKATVYFSKLFTEHPKAPYTTNGLVYLAKSFYRQGQKEQAIATLEALLQKYPHSKKIPTAKALLKKYR